MPLTVKEKEHWKEQIEKRIDKAISLAFRSEGKEWKATILDRARNQAIKSLDLEKYVTQHTDWEAQLEKLRKDKSELIEKTAKRFKDNDIPAHRYTSGDDLIEKVIREEAKIFEEEILKETDTGRTILQLKREREELLDTVWLATSPVQIRDLWKDFTTFVCDKPTQMQKIAMTYVPSESEKEK